MSRHNSLSHSIYVCSPLPQYFGSKKIVVLERQQTVPKHFSDLLTFSTILSLPTLCIIEASDATTSANIRYFLLAIQCTACSLSKVLLKYIGSMRTDSMLFAQIAEMRSHCQFILVCLPFFPSRKSLVVPKD